MASGPASAGRAASIDSAHEIALKAAETDGTKRALATFGNPFGLALYDKDRAGVTRPSPSSPAPRQKLQLFVLCRGEGEELDRKSTRLNSSHLGISYAVFCLKKKKTNK